ncbi:thioredoxin TrxC [Microbulbifer flavimaris]|uniref:Thioredoxin n=1 Tax=Microbulbifer flavimaris TaxID=1781068 RepID=A0ABX4I3I8_9GAMM|nr:MULTISPECIES: thioredoxin TrxC [Microbulbifer]KUJ84660.1 thioredoxin [Microbulbifer sp. ZGT114]PCO06748.1 thioredoxin TrxC [Microbulbifer flavimaris]
MTDSAPLQIVCPACNAVNRVPGHRLGDRPVCGKCRSPLLGGHPVNATDQNFSRFIEKSDLPVVVDFWATWCGPCQQFAPVFSQVSGEMATNAVFVKVDTQANQQAAAQYQIRSIPTLMIFHRGRELARLSGALPKPQFQQWLHQQLASTQAV